MDRNQHLLLLERAKVVCIVISAIVHYNIMLCDVAIDIIYHVCCIGYLSNLYHEGQAEAVRS